MSEEICPDDGTNLIHFDEQDLVGSVLDNRYTIMSRVGKGGMGVVYKAEQHLIGRIVALKVLNKEIVKDETSVKRFLNEARAIASLENPHTVTLYDFGVTTEGLLYYTMELLEGRPLSGLLQAQGHIPLEHAVEIIFQTLESLGEAHDKGILHRDIKPDNLFLQARAKGERVKVLDFGIAKLVGEGSDGTAITKTGMICGTPQYLSPEQVLGNSAVPASDLYSLGVVFYELLAGLPPFYSPTPMKLLLQHLNEIPPPISVKNPLVAVPPSINRFVERVLAKQPEDRFATVGEFRSGLEEALAQITEDTDSESLTALVQTDIGVRALKDSDRVPVGGGTDHLAALANEQTEPVPGETEERMRSAAGYARPPSSEDFEATKPLPGKGISEDSDSTAAVVERFAGKRRWPVLAVLALVVAAGLFAWQPWKTPPAQKEPPTTTKKANVADVVGAVDVEEAAPAGVPVVADVVVQPEVVQQADLRVEPLSDASSAAATVDLIVEDQVPELSPALADVVPDVQAADAAPDVPAVPDIVEVKPEPKQKAPEPRSDRRTNRRNRDKEKKSEKKTEKKHPEEKPAGSDFKRIVKEQPEDSKQPVEPKKPKEPKKPFGFRRIPTD
jgi:serine/threonine protein kinase